MLARTIDSFDKRVALRLMDLSGQIQTIYKITVVGVTSPVTDVPESDQVKVVNSIVAGKEGANIQGHLNELYEEATTDLTEEHKTKVKVTLVRYQNLFSKFKDDFGRTSLIKHKINTEGAKPTKQPPIMQQNLLTKR